MRCGALQRPLDPAKPSGTQIDVHYTVLPALARNKKPDPVFLFAGGPGQSAIDLAAIAKGALERFGNRRDIVLVDQRGTGKSAPLKCAVEDPWQPLATLVNPQRQVAQILKCRDQLQALPYGDLRFFTTTIAMGDADAVRQALGVERINAVGASYGTRAVLEYMRQFPQRVRTAVIDGVAPPDMVLMASSLTDGQAALDAVFAACNASADCERQYPQLQQRVRAWLGSLPREITVDHPASGKPESMVLTQDTVMQALRLPLYAPSFAAAIPEALSAAMDARYEPLMALAGSLTSRRSAMAMGMHFSVMCAEDAPRWALSTDKPGTDYTASQSRLHREVCSAWPRGDVPAAFYTVPPTNTPTLVLSGGADPVTPPRHGERISKLLGAKATHIVVPQAGHGLLSLPCMRELIYRFVDDADQPNAAGPIDASCATNMPRPPAFVPPRPATNPKPGATAGLAR